MKSENLKELLVSSYTELPECWVHFNGMYVYYSPNTSRQMNLPQVHIEYESVLNNLKIPYRKSFIISHADENLEFWNNNQYEEEEFELPLYEYLPSLHAYRNINQSYIGKRPTEKAISAAWGLMQSVYQATYEYDFILKDKRIKKAITKVLNNKEAVVVKLNELGQELKDEILICGTENFISDTEDYKFKIIAVMTLFPKYQKSKYYAIFDVKKIELQSKIDIYVPKRKIGLIIGKECWQIKEWENFFKVKINVVGN